MRGVAPAVLLVAASGVLAGCAAAPPAAPARDPVLSFEAARRQAWAPRRFKALFRGEVAPKVGTVVRGYLSVFWDGNALVWRASAPLAGTARTGVLTRFGTEDSGLVPGRLAGSDALGALLGAPNLPAEPAGVRFEKGRSRIALAGERAALLDAEGRIVGLSYPGGIEVTLEPGEGVPRRIAARGPSGSAVLTLESYGPWPEGEAIPGGAAR